MSPIIMDDILIVITSNILVKIQLLIKQRRRRREKVLWMTSQKLSVIISALKFHSNNAQWYILLMRWLISGNEITNESISQFYRQCKSIEINDRMINFQWEIQERHWKNISTKDFLHFDQQRRSTMTIAQWTERIKWHSHSKSDLVSKILNSNS